MEPIAVGDVLDGKYEIVGTLGEGAMGVVFSARHTALNKRVAIKTLRAEIAADTTLIGRFEQEARAASAIGHPNIVQVFDLGSTPDGARYMVMEYLTGESLAETIERSPVLEPARVVGLTTQVLSALAAAHKRGIVHRDLKPENIFVVRSDDHPETVKLLDFGISKVLAEIADPRIAGDSQARATRIGTVLGTPLYMSPEQASGVPDIDHRTDLWAVGVCLYEMLTGRPPFDGANYNQIMGAIIKGGFAPPRGVNPAIPARIEQVIMRGLAHDRADRFQSASEMREALQAAAAGVSEPPPARVTAPTRALGGRGAPPAPAAAASVRAPADAAVVADSQTGLAAAAGGVGNEDAFLSALAKIDSGEAEIGLGSTGDPEPPPRPQATPPPMATGTPPAVAASAGGPAPADMFAPPDSESEALELDLAVADPTLERIRTSEARAKPAPSAPAAANAGRAPATPRRQTGTAAATRPSGGGAGKLIGILVAVLVLGAGGFAAYRYATLGYLLEPAATPAITTTIRVVPESASITVDGLAFAGGPLELRPDQPRLVRARASGRLQHEVAVVAPAEGDPQPVELALPHRLPKVALHLAPATDEDGGPAAASGPDAMDEALARLRAYASCLLPAGDALAVTHRGYVAKTRRKARNIQRNNIPKISLVGPEVMSECRGLAQLASAGGASLAEVGDRLTGTLAIIDEMNAVLADVASYYDDEKFRNDRLRWGRKKHSEVVQVIDAAVEAHRAAADLVADRTAYWLKVEVEQGGDDLYWQLRRLAVAGQLWVGSLTRSLGDGERAARGKALLAAYRSATEQAAANPERMQAIDGAGGFLEAIKPLIGLAEESATGAEPARAVLYYNNAAEAFNTMVL